MKSKLTLLIVIVLSILFNSVFFYYRNISASIDYYIIYAIYQLVNIAFWASLTIYTIGLGNHKRIAFLFLLPIVYSILGGILCAHIMTQLNSITVYNIINNIFIITGNIIVIVACIFNNKHSRIYTVTVIAIFALIKILRFVLIIAGLTILDYYLIHIIRDILIFVLLIVEIFNYCKNNKIKNILNSI